jgi:alpha-mannosidase
VLFNETHDLASGVMTDHVYDDTVGSYAYAERRAGAIINAKWDVLTSRIDTRGPGAPVLVFNPLGWRRTDAAFVDLEFGEGNVTGVSVTDAEGQTVPSQIVESTRYWDGGLKTARVVFVARDIPALGYSTFSAAAAKSSTTGAGEQTEIPAPRPASGETILENGLYRMSVDSQSGAITGLVYKPASWNVLAGRANVVSREEDRGDLWEPYKGLDGGSRIAMTNQQKVPLRGKAVYSDEGAGGTGTVFIGPVVSEFRVERPFGTGKFATTIKLFQGLRRIEMTTRLVNQEKYVRYQAHFPTSIKDGKATHEIPFGAIDRPNAIEFPAQNWADYSDGHRGLAVLNVGLPGNLVSEGTMLVSLLRAHTLGAYGFGGGYERGMTSDTGFQLGRERSMRYAMIPHDGNWRDAGVVRDGWEFNHPLVCRTVLPHEGSLPKRWGLVDVSSPDVVVSSLKPSRENDVALRVYEASGRPATGVTLNLSTKVLGAQEANLMEDPGKEISTPTDHSVRFDLHPFEIKTIRLRLAPL